MALVITPVFLISLILSPLRRASERIVRARETEPAVGYKFYYVILFNCKQYTNAIRRGADVEKFRLCREIARRIFVKKFEFFREQLWRLRSRCNIDNLEAEIFQSRSLISNVIRRNGSKGDRTLLSHSNNILLGASYEKIRDEKMNVRACGVRWNKSAKYQRVFTDFLYLSLFPPVIARARARTRELTKRDGKSRLRKKPSTIVVNAFQMAGFHFSIFAQSLKQNFEDDFENSRHLTK